MSTAKLHVSRETDTTIRSIIEKMTPSTKTPEEDRAKAIGNMHKNDKDQMLADRVTEGHMN